MTFDEWWLQIKPAECDELKPYFIECWQEAELAALKQGEPVAWLIRDWAGYEDVATDSWGMAALAKKQGATVIELFTSAPTIQEGYALVPVEPTQQILEGLEVGMSYDECNNSEFDARIAYQAMLAAAPKPKEPQDD